MRSIYVFCLYLGLVMIETYLKIYGYETLLLKIKIMS